MSANELAPSYGGALQSQPRSAGGVAPSNLADILERVLDKGIVIAGDIQINLLDIELLTIKLRLLIASVDRAREMGINWWESDASLSSDAQDRQQEARSLRERVEQLEQAAGLPSGESAKSKSGRGKAGGAR